jgi:hypothetical protein
MARVSLQKRGRHTRNLLLLLADEVAREGRRRSQGLPQRATDKTPSAANFSALKRAEQIVGPERRGRVSRQTWCGEG